jgi:hypothetical protein
LGAAKAEEASSRVAIKGLFMAAGYQVSRKKPIRGMP